MKLADFRRWVNDKENGLFGKTSQLEGCSNLSQRQKKTIPQLPISLTTARSRLHRLGYEWRRVGKGYFDAHERADVVLWRRLLCQRLTHLWPRINNWFYLTIPKPRILA